MSYRQWRLPIVLWLGGNCLLLTAWAAVRETTNPTIGRIHTGASVVAVLAAIAFGMLLFAPQKRWLRLLAVVLPPVLIGLRVISLVLDESVHWTGLTFAVILFFVYTLAGPTMLPPPTTNGEAKQWMKSCE